MNFQIVEPQFVASFEVDDVVYFFFREIAVEFTGFMKKIASRVAQVCKVRGRKR